MEERARRAVRVRQRRHGRGGLRREDGGQHQDAGPRLGHGLPPGRGGRVGSRRCGGGGGGWGGARGRPDPRRPAPSMEQGDRRGGGLPRGGGGRPDPRRPALDPAPSMAQGEEVEDELVYEEEERRRARWRRERGGKKPETRRPLAAEEQVVTCASCCWTFAVSSCCC